MTANIMEEDPASIAAAIEIMREWEWRGADQDGVWFHPGKELGFVVNRLALEGMTQPDEAVLALLCSGRLVSWGDYRWRKYHHGTFYQLEGENEILKPSRWQRLADIIARHLQELAGPDWPSAFVDLEQLTMMRCSIYEWEFSANRFSIAIRTPETKSYEPTYLEEWFSAWDIYVRPNDLEPPTRGNGSTPELIASSSNKGGRPPAADWEAAALDIAGRYYRGDFKPQTIADVGRELSSWLGKQDLHPSDSVVRIHAKRIFDAFRAWESE